MDYKEKLEEAKRLYETANADQKYLLESLFPELKSRAYERIRKNCIRFLELQKMHHVRTVEIDECIDWLEKQGEQKTTKIEVNTEELSDFERSLKHIIEEAIEDGDTHNLKADADMLLRIAQKSAWSEEDERNLEGIIDEIEANKNNAPDYDLATYDRFFDWLKSLKDRYTWKPTEEQISALEYHLNNTWYESWQYAATKQLLNDLKKL